MGKEGEYKNKERMLKSFFRIVDSDRSGKVSVSEMSRFLQQDDMMHELGPGATGDDHRDMKLGLFDLWESKLEEGDHGDVELELSEAEFLTGVCQSWGDMDQKTLWRSITGTRKSIRDLTNLVRQQQKQLDLISH